MAASCPLFQAHNGVYTPRDGSLVRPTVTAKLPDSVSPVGA